MISFFFCGNLQFIVVKSSILRISHHMGCPFYVQTIIKPSITCICILSKNKNFALTIVTNLFLVMYNCLHTCFLHNIVT